MSSPDGADYVPPVENQKLYADFMAEAHKRELSGSENFDKSILTLSSAGLGLSVGYLKDYAPIDPAAIPWLLYVSWFAFVLSTVSTLLSFMSSSKALDVQKGIAEKFYMQGDLAAFGWPNKWNTLTLWMNRASAVSFVAALVCTAVFFIVITEEKRMYKIKNPESGSPELLQKGAPVPTMQKPAPAPAAPSFNPLSPEIPSADEKREGPAEGVAPTQSR